MKIRHDGHEHEFEAAHGAVIGELSTTGELIDTHELAVPGALLVSGGLERSFRDMGIRM